MVLRSRCIQRHGVWSPPSPYFCWTLFFNIPLETLLTLISLLKFLSFARVAYYLRGNRSNDPFLYFLLNYFMYGYCLIVYYLRLNHFVETVSSCKWKHPLLHLLNNYFIHICLHSGIQIISKSHWLNQLLCWPFSDPFSIDKKSIRPSL